MRCCPRSCSQPGDDEQGLVREAQVEKAQDFNGKQETFAVRNANGTGPFLLDRYEPDVRTCSSATPRWWGWTDKRSGNVDEVVFAGDPLRRDAAGRAHLGRGRPGARPAVPGRRAAEERRAADRVQHRRPRQAIPHLRPWRATSSRATRRQGQEPVQGHSRPPRRLPRAQRRPDRAEGAARPGDADRRLPVAARRRLAAELDKRLPFDPAKARALLAEAGYPNGSRCTLDCVNVA